jgi:hypothetical protein
MKLFLGIPTAGTPAPAFLQSLASLAVPANISAFERAIVTGNFVPAQRDTIVERALAWGADTIAMCDDDMVLPPEALVALIGALDAGENIALAGALYYSRDGLRPMVVDGWDGTDTTRGWIPAFDDRTPVDVAGVGFGCVVVRAQAAAQLARPLFPSHVLVEREAGRVRVCNEDYLFCERLRGTGKRVVLHPGVRCGHYDRAHDRVMPAHWESPAVTGRPRVFVRSGDRYELVPLAGAPEATTPETRTKADVVYLEV